MAIQFLNNVNADNGVLYVDAVNDRVGIGTTSPTEKLTIEGASTPTIEITDTSTPVTLHVSSANARANIGTTTSHPLRVLTNDTERMRINSDGDVGIGTTSPQQKLQVASPSSTSVVLGASYLSTNDNNFFEVGINANDGYLNLRNSGVSTTVHIDSDGDSYFNGGNVGIGTTSPTTKLHVTGDIRLTNTGPIFISEATNGTSGLRMNTIGGTGGSILRVQESGTTKFQINYNGDVGIGTTSPQSKLQLNGGDGLTVTANDGAYSDGYFGRIQSDYGTNALRLVSRAGDVFRATNYGQDVAILTGTTSTGTSEKMRITSTGNVGIGTTNPSEKLEVVGAIKMSENASYPLTIDHDSTTTTNEITTVGGLNIITGSNNTISFKDSTTTNMSISGYSGDVIMGYNTGKVGIGTTSPTDKLTVEDGNIRLNSTSSYPAQGLYAYWNNGSPNMGGISWHNNPGFIGSEWNHYKQSSPYTQARIRLIGDTSGGMFVNLNNSDVFTILASNGNVGIGATSPGAKLEVEQSNSSTNTVFLSNSYNNKGFRIGNSGYATFSGYQDGDNTTSGTAYGALIGLNTFYDGTNFYNDNQYVDPSSILFKDGNILFYTNDVSATGNFTPNERLIITKTGNVGIGTSGPGAKLDVASGDIRLVTNATYFRVKDTASGVPRVLGMNASNTTYVGPIDSYAGGGIVYGASSNVAYHDFYGGGSTKVRITSAGDVGIGTTSPTDKLHIDGTVLASSTMTATNFILSSDKKLKENIKDLNSKPLNVKWRKFELKSEPGIHRVGVIAQELEKTNPEFIREDKDGLKSVAYIDLLITKIAELEARLEKAGL